MDGILETATPGWVYVLTSPALPGIVKVGMTARDPELRAEEIAEPHGLTFEVAYKVPCADCKVAENRAHKMLMRSRAYGADLREMLNVSFLEGVTEFFRVDTATAIAVVDAAVDSILLPARVSPEAYWIDGARARGRIIEPLRPPRVEAPRRERLPVIMAAVPVVSVTPMLTDATRSAHRWAVRRNQLTLLLAIGVAIALLVSLWRQLTQVPPAARTPPVQPAAHHHDRHHHRHHWHHRS